VTSRVVVFAPNWLGDAVMALPAIADLCRARPGATIDIAARPSIAPLVPLIPGVGRALVLGDRRASVDAVKAGAYDESLLLPNSFNAAWIARSAGVPERWGYRNQFRSVLLTRACSPPSRVHQVEYYQRLTTALGFAPGLMVPQLRVSSELGARGAALLADRGWDRRSRLVAVAPGAAFGSAKRWPAERFAATIDALARDGVRSVLIGAPADRAATREVIGLLRSESPPIDLVGATDLQLLAAVLVQTRAIVTNDSGAMHVAAALGINVTAIFGPTNERETRPLGSGRRSVVHGETWCRPCMLRECPLTHRCMTGVGVETVVTDMRANL
jgi:heptosyltransferase II